MSDHQLTTSDRSIYNTMAASRVVGEHLFDAVEAQVATAVRVLTPAEILALDATPIEVVAAPGAGKAVVVLGTMISMDFNSVAYTGISQALQVRYVGGDDWTDGALVGFANLSVDALRWFYDGAPDNAQPLLNTAVEASVDGAGIADGDSSWTVHVFYRIIDFDTIGGQ